MSHVLLLNMDTGVVHLCLTICLSMLLFDVLATEIISSELLKKFGSIDEGTNIINKNQPKFNSIFIKGNIDQTSHFTKFMSHNFSEEDLIQAVVLPGQFLKQYTVQITRSTEYIFDYIYNNSLLNRQALRITVFCPTSRPTYPLLVVVRQQKEVMSWQLPLEAPPNTFTTEEYKTISRTLCPPDYHERLLHLNQDETQRLFVDVTTSSLIPLNFSLQVEVLEEFIIELTTTRTIQVSPGESVYYYFQFPDDVDMVLVKAVSDDDICAMLAIQNSSCPVFDTEETVKYGKLYQTMTLQAGITVRKANYPRGFYIILVTLSNDDECSPGFQHIYLHRTKNVTLLIEEKITFWEYLSAIFAGIAFCLFFYVVAIVLACIEFIRNKKKTCILDQSLLNDSLIRNSYNDHSFESTSTLQGESSGACALSTTSSLEEEEYDALEDAESEKDVFRTKTVLFVSDLARKDTKVLKYKSSLYIIGLLTVAIFYAVPVVQLVVTYLKVLDVTGNQDICYYNFWCAHPLGLLSDFNHVYSNIAYILFGLLFIGLCARKENRHRSLAQKNRNIDKCHGIPQHFGLFYAMGCALIMEGLLSGCYHICPNYSNFQFDTAFMYVIAVLCMIKIYQTRHPDINASANATYFVLAITVFIGVIGVLNGKIYFWVVFALIHVISCFIISGRLYYMGRWKIDRRLLHRLVAWIKSELHAWRMLLYPTYCDRFILLFIGNLANWVLSIYGVITTPKDFASYLLIIFVTNLLLYISFYIIMKLRHKETIHLQPLAYIFLCAGAWGAAAYFFLDPSTTWELTPAHSRQFNHECSLLHFYDSHDIWHFLSSAAMFFGFMLLLTLDDDLIFTPRSKIPVF